MNTVSTAQVIKSKERLHRKVQLGQFRFSQRCGFVHSFDRHYLTEIGPGLFADEHHDIDIQLCEQAKMWLEPQAWCKVFPGKKSLASADQIPLPASVRTEISIYQGSSLVFLNAPLIIYGGGSFKSRTVIRIGQESRAIFSEIIAKRVSNPDKGRSCYLDSELEIYVDAQLVMNDIVEVTSNPLFSNDETWDCVTGEDSCIGALYLLGYKDLEMQLDDFIGNEVNNTPIVSAEIAHTTDSLTTIRVTAPHAQFLLDYFTKIANFLAEKTS